MHKEAIEVAYDMKKCIKDIEDGLKLVKPANDAWAKADAEYDKQLALAIIRLENGVELELDGEKVQNPRAAALKEIAKGIVSNYKFEKNTTDSERKRITQKLNHVATQLNGHQSVNKHFSHLPNE